MPEYADQLREGVNLKETSHAVQLITMSGLQTELGMGPLFPQDVDAFAKVIARAACGILGYTGQTDGSSVPIGEGDAV